MLYLIIFIFIYMCFPLIRFLLWKWPCLLWAICCSVVDVIVHKRWNESRAYGRIMCYTGLFGQGKTKECVRFITEHYKQYNGKMIYDPYEKEWIEQEIRVYSNVELTIPYIQLTSLQQLVDCQGTNPGIVNLFLIDEASVVFNSREFKNNFSTPALNTILTSRHHKIGIFLTAQRFGHMDALLRQVTARVYECNYWPFARVQRIREYDAWDLENCTTLSLVKPLSTRYYFTTKKVYGYYNTLAMVSDIAKQCKDKVFATDAEVLVNQGTAGDFKLVKNYSRRGKKRV